MAKRATLLCVARLSTTLLVVVTHELSHVARGLANLGVTLRDGTQRPIRALAILGRRRWCSSVLPYGVEAAEGSLVATHAVTCCCDLVS